MEISRIDLGGFRHLPNERYFFAKGINLIIGPNGIGKTSLLEAVACLSDGSSFRTKDDLEMISYGNDYTVLDSRVVFEDLSHRVKFAVTKMGKVAQIDAHSLRRMSKLIGNFIAIVFVPQDIYFFQEAPRIRRKFIDLEISKVEPRFINYLLNYRKLLKEKSIHLKSLNPSCDLLHIYNQQLAQLSVKIIFFRKRFLQALENDVNLFFQSISKKEGRLQFSYISECDLPEVDLVKMFDDLMEKELLKKIIIKGVHLDDFTLRFQMPDAVFPVANYFSQGEQRIVVLALKLALMKIVAKVRNEEAVLLLDDVLSELDYQKQENLLKILKNFNQVLITTNEIDHLPQDVVLSSHIIDLNRKEKTDGTAKTL